MHPFIDSHAHLSMLASRGMDTHAYLDRLFSEGFGAILDIGTKADDLEARFNDFALYDRVRFSAGIWPSKESIENRISLVAELEAQITAHLTANLDSAQRGRVVAIGEAGLDRHWNKKDAISDPLARGTNNLEGERELFELQAQAAFRRNLPLIVHSREAAAETVEVLAQYPGLQGVIHCYSYGFDEVKDFLDLGFYISFAGTLTYPSAKAQREAAKYVPADRLLLETDAPYLAPVPHRGKYAEPGMVALTYAYMAELRSVGIDKLVDDSANNIKALFSF